MNSAAYDWLIVTRSGRDYRHINNILNATAIRFDQNIVVAYHDNLQQNLKFDLCKKNFIYDKVKFTKNSKRQHENNNNKNYFETNYYRTSERFRNISKWKIYKSGDKIMPLLKSGLLGYNFSKPFVMVNVSQQTLNNFTKSTYVNYEYKINVFQYFKLRLNATLFAAYLGKL